MTRPAPDPLPEMRGKRIALSGVSAAALCQHFSFLGYTRGSTRACACAHTRVRVHVKGAATIVKDVNTRTLDLCVTTSITAWLACQTVDPRRIREPRDSSVLFGATSASVKEIGTFTRSGRLIRVRCVCVCECVCECMCVSECVCVCLGCSLVPALITAWYPLWFTLVPALSTAWYPLCLQPSTRSVYSLVPTLTTAWYPLCLQPGTHSDYSLVPALSTAWYPL